MDKVDIEVIDSVFTGDSQMSKLLKEFNWDKTVLGPVSTWPQSLKTSVGIMLGSHYPMFVWWGSDMIMFYNDAYLPVLGIKHPDSVGKSGRVVWAEIWDSVGYMFEDVLAKGQASFAQQLLFYIYRNGFKEETYFTFSYSPITQEDGAVGGIFCACVEDTQQVLSSRRLETISKISSIKSDISIQDSRNEVVKVISDNPNDVPFVILYTCKDGNIELNQYSEDRFTLPLDYIPELKDGSSFISGAPDNKGIKVLPIPASLKGVLREYDHGVLPEKVVLVPVEDASQNVIRGYLVLGISGVLPFNDDYLKFIDLLSSQINALVTNIRLLEQERLLSKKLIELDKSKTTFFSNVSHELRTPLTLILGPLELLLSKSEDLAEDDKVNLQTMQRNAMRLLKQVNNLLNFASIEAGRYNSIFSPINLTALTAELASTFKTLIEKAGIKYNINCSLISEPVYVDIEMWEMIMLNLLSNAYKYTLSGSITVDLIEKEHTVELHISDTGVCIPQEEIPKLFNKFYRIEKNVGRTNEGSGVGLALVAESVKLHSGTINVTSQEGKGSKFIVSIPKGVKHLPKGQIKDESNVESLATDIKPQYLLEAESWPKLFLDTTEDRNENNFRTNNTGTESLPSILLVDDNLDIQNYIIRILKQDYDIVTAANGQEALAILADHVPDLILSDVMMPVMDGVTLLQKVRDIPALSTIPFIFLSARAGENDRFVGFESGADDYLVKPFTAIELTSRVKSNINNSKLRIAWKAQEQQLILEANTKQKNLEKILDSISDTFAFLSPKLEYVYVNRNALNLVDYDLESILGRHLLDVFPHLEESTLLQNIKKAQKSMNNIFFEYYDELFKFWFDVRIYPAANGISVFLANNTERKQQEQAGIETEKRFMYMANAAPVLIWMSGTDMLCDFFNDSWIEFRGRTLEEELGNGWTEGVHPDDLDYCLETYETAFKEREKLSMEYRLLNKDGEYRWLLDVGVPRFTENGQFLGYIGACTDISERKWAEAILDQYNKELENSVTFRTQELLQLNDELLSKIDDNNIKEFELAKSHKQLQSLTSYLQDLRENERKLIAREIHDELGQALAALKIEMSLLHDRIDSSKSKYKVGMLDNLSSMEYALDESLLSIRKIISHLRPSLSDDLELVYEIKRLVSDLEKRVGITITVISEVEKIELEPKVAIEVYRAVQESVTNIMKHAQATSAKIEIIKNENKFKFVVTDNGIGFNEEILSKKKSFGILGLKERAQRIGASVTINSCLGKGTTVELLVDATVNIIH